MTSTTSNDTPTWGGLAAILIPLYALALVLFLCALTGCEENPQPTVNNKTRIVTAPTTSSQAETQESPKPPPASTAPAEESDPQREPPYFGSTYFDELLTSVYYYPGETKGDAPMTHLKFSHREDLVYLCGDQRKSFEPGNRIRLMVTFEPNAPCITNWKVK